MRSIDSFFVFILFILIAVPTVVYFAEKDPFNIAGNFVPAENNSQTASLSDAVSVDDLKNRYKRFSNGRNHVANRIKVLIVPGHDDVHHGATFNGLREVDLNRELAKNLYQFLLKDKNFRVFLASDENGFNDRIENYLEEEKNEIEEFRKFKKQITESLIDSGEIQLEQYVAHNSAPEEVANVLYGINRYANEEDFDIVLHVHFNDYPGRPKTSEGKHSGISIYVPASQYSNGSASLELAENIFGRLTKIFSPSTNPAERVGVIQDTELIAVGAFNSVDSIALLMEYGYIYEPQLTDENLRPVVLKELAYQTYVGMKYFFDENYVASNSETTLLPYTWYKDLDGKEKTDLDVFALQILLRLYEMYPPMNNFEDCPITGSFGKCTETALKNFQDKYGLETTGKLDSNTRDFLHDLI
ncbi:MAG: N-acetylmuramoyl-L-alanine amidase [Candidatus Paceibacterota bacterium]